VGTSVDTSLAFIDDLFEETCLNIYCFALKQGESKASKLTGRRQKWQTKTLGKRVLISETATAEHKLQNFQHTYQYAIWIWLAV